jgi:hypothetical protein
MSNKELTLNFYNATEVEAKDRSIYASSEKQFLLNNSWHWA